MRLSLLLITLLLSFLFVACSSKPITRPASVAHKTYQPVSFKNQKNIKSALYSQLKDWRGVKYKEGGLSKNGVDCSGFIHLTFYDRFALNVPRTTELLIKAGKPVRKKALKPGDLVFFKTGLFKRHVGIYIENGKFIHASTSKGVILSALDNVYWSKHYWKSIRLAV